MPPGAVAATRGNLLFADFTIDTVIWTLFKHIGKKLQKLMTGHLWLKLRIFGIYRRVKHRDGSVEVEVENFSMKRTTTLVEK